MVEINNWNQTDELTFSMCRSLHFLTITGDLEYIDGIKLRIPSPNVTDFHIENSRLQRIDDYSFQHFPSVKNLIITSNSQLEKLSPYFLHGLDQMYYLDLSFNGLLDISESFLVNLNTLKILKLNHNKITAIYMDTFKHLRQLKVLELSNNKLTMIGDFGLRGLLNVVNLHLDSNSLTELNHLELLEMVSLQDLNLLNNRIEVFNLPSCNKQLRMISLNYNNLSAVPIITQTRCSGLKKVLIRHNPIVECVGKGLHKLFDMAPCEYSFESVNCPTNPNSSYVGLCIVLIMVSLCILTLSVFVPILIYKHQRKTGCKKFQLKKSIFNTTFSNQFKQQSETQDPIMLR